MKDLLEFMGVLLIAAMVGGLIYAIVKRKLALGISLIVGLLVVGVLWWWLSSPPTTTTLSESKTLSHALQAPEPKKVWEFFKDYWLWAILVLTGLYFWFDGMTPAPAWSKGAKSMIVALAVLMTGAMVVHGIWGEKSPSQQTQQQLVMPMLTMPANGDSPHISAPDAGYAPSFTGFGFVSRCVYSNGNDLEYPCVTGPIVYYYVRDTSGKTNTVSYKWVRP